MRFALLPICAAMAFAAPSPQFVPPPPGFQVPKDPRIKQADTNAPAQSKKPKEKPPQSAPKNPERRTGKTQAKAAEAAPAPAPKPGAYGPGQDVGSGFRACVPGDTTPAGTVKQGYRKFTANTPFGASCRWEKAPGVPDTPAPAAPIAAGPLPGIDVGGGYRGCAASDNAATGTVQNGYRKVMANTPFGATCRWEPVGSGETQSAAATEFRACAADDPSPAGTVRDGFRKVEAMTSFGKTCRWERTTESR